MKLKFPGIMIHGERRGQISLYCMEHQVSSCQAPNIHLNTFLICRVSATVPISIVFGTDLRTYRHTGEKGPKFRAETTYALTSGFGTVST